MNDQERFSEKGRGRYQHLDDLLSTTFNAILRIEERSLRSKLTEGLTMSEVHTLVALGLYEENPMNVVASRLGVTLATLTTAVNKLVEKGFIERRRSESDRRKVLIALSKKGRQAYRAHSLFHQKMINESLAGLTEEEVEVFARALGKVKAFFEQEGAS
ncbi:MAG: MarR family transcriptional regulator [Coriobacteriaceae bacterium]|jgi:DNA-binding MarR family transcriptional regulator|nr:MarR family transcriptional regulator [Coriobacteriaceae bacterium]